MSETPEDIQDNGKITQPPEETLKQKAFKGVFWKIAEVGGKQGVQLVISIILARLIAPEQFGAIAMLSIFIAVASAFIDSGFSDALIRKNDRTQIDCSTVFYFNLVIALAAYGILFICAPWVADFYEMPVLRPVLRVSALQLIIGAFSSVQHTLFSASLNFKLLAKYNVLSLVISGSVGIFLAYHDFQVWALVWQSITGQVVSTCFLWWKSSWRPSLMFSFKTLKEFFGFGSKLLASGLLDTIYNNMYSVVIGKVYNASDLAYYNRAKSLRNMTSSMPTGVLQSVTYPTLCKLQGNDDALRNGYRRTLRVSAFVIFPLCLGMGAVSYPLINILFTSKWMAAAPMLTILVFSGMWYPIHAINLNLLVVKGRSELFFRLEVIKKIVGVAMLCITVPLGLIAMCYGMICTSLIALAINTYYTGKLLNLGIIVQMRDLAHILILSMIMFVAVKMLTNLLGLGVISLLVGIISGCAIYILGSWIFRFSEMKELLNWRK